MAQLAQDLFVVRELNGKRGGFFVEFGATDGFELSNTYLLEKDFGWNGILAEPAKSFHPDLIANRNARIDFDCVWNKTGQILEFNETDIRVLSTIDTYSAADKFEETRKNGTLYPVHSISLIDLLKKHDAPRKIDYLSIDTEGSEYDILAVFNFSEYEVSIITVEHNHTLQRDKIYALLTANGYERVLTNMSKWDDWYVLKT